MKSITFLSLWLTVVVTTSCSDAYEGQSLAVVAPPSTNFVYVSEPLDFSCGSLECHGTAGRNLRLYGTFGQRLSSADVPCTQKTTPAEVEANYRSAVALEPEVMAEVVESGGAHPERLTLVRKARGTESHKGGAVFPEGSLGDRCLVSWLTGTVDQPSCNNFFSNNPNHQVICPQATQP